MHVKIVICYILYIFVYVEEIKKINGWLYSLLNIFQDTEKKKKIVFAWYIKAAVNVTTVKFEKISICLTIKTEMREPNIKILAVN